MNVTENKNEATETTATATAAIQGIRLEFYEMFSRCYKGGGRKFTAFNIKKA